MPEPISSEHDSRVRGPLGWILDLRNGEIGMLLLAFGYFFFTLASYFILKPIREDMAAAGGTGDIPWLYSGTFVGMCLTSPLFALAVARLPRRRFVTLAYGLAIACLLIFYSLWQGFQEGGRLWLGRVFFIWVSVFNMFVLSIFWSVQSDVFSIDQGKRLFGSIAVGGTLGTIAGSGLTLFLASSLGTANLLLLSVGLLACGLLCARKLMARDRAAREAIGEHHPVIGGGILAGLTRTIHSPYLLGISAYIVLMTFGSTFLYVEQINISKEIFGDDRAARTEFFSMVNLFAQSLTLVVQIFFTSRVIKNLGIGLTLCSLPALSLLGFVALGAADLGIGSVFWIFITFEVMRRVVQRGLARPSREILFTLVDREDKYKSKNFIDTVVYRGGDVSSAWILDLARAAIGSLAGMAALILPMMLVWTGLGLFLGRRQRKMAAKPPGTRPGHFSRG